MLFHDVDPFCGEAAFSLGVVYLSSAIAISTYCVTLQEYQWTRSLNHFSIRAPLFIIVCASSLCHRDVTSGVWYLRIPDYFF